MKQLIIFFCILSAILQANAQISITSSSKNIYIGEQFTISYTLTKDIAPQKLQFPSFTDSIPHFELIAKGPLDSVRQGSEMIYTQDIRYTSFDSGRWVIPARTFIVGNKKMLSDTLIISVLPVKLKSKNYHDIHEIIDVPKPNEELPKWLIASAVVLLVALFLFFILRNSKSISPVTQVVVDPYQQAITALDHLRKEKSDIKTFYTHLYVIYRRFLSGKEKTALDSFTTDDLILFMKGKMKEDDFFAVSEVLRIADAVKFARYPSSKEDALKSYDRIRIAIDNLHKQSKS